MHKKFMNLESSFKLITRNSFALWICFQRSSLTVCTRYPLKVGIKANIRIAQKTWMFGRRISKWLPDKLPVLVHHFQEKKKDLQRTTVLQYIAKMQNGSKNIFWSFGNRHQLNRFSVIIALAQCIVIALTNLTGDMVIIHHVV